MNEIMQRLNDVFRDVFEDDQLVVDSSTSAKDVEEWDSLMHVSLMLNVEKAFGIRFTTKEIARLQNVGQLAELIGKRLTTQPIA